MLAYTPLLWLHKDGTWVPKHVAIDVCNKLRITERIYWMIYIDSEGLYFVLGEFTSQRGRVVKRPFLSAWADTWNNLRTLNDADIEFEFKSHCGGSPLPTHPHSTPTHRRRETLWQPLVFNRYFQILSYFLEAWFCSRIFCPCLLVWQSDGNVIRCWQSLISSVSGLRRC